MHRLFVLWLLLGGAVVSGAQQLTDADVNAAISQSSKYKPVHLVETLNLSSSGYKIEIYSPIAWVKTQAAKAKHEMRPFATDAVDDQMRADVWRIMAWPSTPRKINDTATASSVDHVVLRNKSSTIVIQPLTKEPFEDHVQNAFGAGYTYTGLLATFPGDGVRELWGPNKDQPFWVSVIGQHWKYDFEIKDKHFAQLK